MIQDFRYILIFILKIFCNIFLKLIDIQFYYFILNLIKNLKFSLKYQIIIGLFKVLLVLNFIKMN